METAFCLYVLMPVYTVFLWDELFQKFKSDRLPVQFLVKVSHACGQETHHRSVISGIAKSLFTYQVPLSIPWSSNREEVQVSLHH